MSTHDVAVSRVFLLNRNKQIFAHLSSFEWDFTPGEVRIRCGEEVFVVQQIGSGNHEGRAVVVLSPIGSWDEVTAYIGRIQASGKPIMIEK